MSEWLHQGLDRQLQRDAGMPHVHYGILVSLSEAPEHTLAMSDLAGGLDHSLSRLSHAVSRLEQLGWAERRRSGSDARVTLVRLTAAGLEALRAAAPGHVAWVRSAVIDPLSPEQLAMLEEICTAVMSALAADRGDPACVDRALRRPPGTGAPI
jgi:DNA-binding MarR family transcriptional regulator